MRIAIVLTMLACNGSSSMRAVCTDMQRSVSQAHGTCRIAADPSAPFGTGCPTVMEAYCIPDGLETSCPPGWSLGCTGGPVLTDCTYGTANNCTSVDAENVDINFVQTLNGSSGVTVLVDTSSGDPATWLCEFRPCNP